jgi:outer membrane immunogenic protein
VHDWLFYATGGLAFGDVQHSYSIVAESGDSAFASGSKVQTGWTIGGGSEYNFGKWSLRGEYLFYDLGDAHLNAVGLAPDGSPTDNEFPSETRTSGHIVRVGVNFPLR